MQLMQLYYKQQLMRIMQDSQKVQSVYAGYIKKRIEITCP